jgi:HAD superfamily hydrolase (TIGR01509 family)
LTKNTISLRYHSANKNSNHDIKPSKTPSNSQNNTYPHQTKTILVDAVNTLVIKGEGIYQPLYNLLETYPNPKIILTGANDEQMETLGLNNMPYPVFTLKHNPEKTDPSYYKTLLQTYQLQPEEVIYFEHNPEAVESAKSVGITTHYYNPETKDLESLKKFLEDNM